MDVDKDIVEPDAYKPEPDENMNLGQQGKLIFKLRDFNKILEGIMEQLVTMSLRYDMRLNHILNKSDIGFRQKNVLTKLFQDELMSMQQDLKRVISGKSEELKVQIHLDKTSERSNASDKVEFYQRANKSPEESIVTEEDNIIIQQ